jgi:hypothetical protein
VPVLLKRASLAEVFPDISIFVNDPDIAKIKNALIEGLVEEKKVEGLLNRFEEKRSYFSWSRAAGEFLTVMEKCLA